MPPPEPTASRKQSSLTRILSPLAGFVGDPAIICLLLATGTLMLYWPATGFAFVNYDDPDYFSANPHVQNGLTWSGILWSFGATTASNWHPLTWLSLMMDVSLFGDAGPGGSHLTNIVFHAINCGLLFWLLWRLREHDGGAPWSQDCLPCIRSMSNRWPGFRNARMF